MDDGAFVIRAIRPSDLDWLCNTAHTIGSGFTSVPDNKEFLQARLALVDKSFQQTIPVEERIFLFGLEILATGKLIGICGIHADVGYKVPFYNYQISTVTQVCDKLNIYLDHQVLNVVDNFQTASELISFWIEPTYRGKNFAKVLSFARFLFIAQHPQLFGQQIISEIRGVSDAAGNSPFWDAIGQHFFNMDFKTADNLTMTMGKQFISDLMPREPIYYDLLPDRAKQVIGVPHPESAAAKHLLESQGLKYNNYIDIFDAGPLLNAEQQDIKIIAASKLAIVEQITDQVTNGVGVIVYNTKPNPLLTAANILITAENKINIDTNTASILQLQPGDQVRFVGI